LAQGVCRSCGPPLPCSLATMRPVLARLCRSAVPRGPKAQSQTAALGACATVGAAGLAWTCVKKDCGPAAAGSFQKPALDGRVGELETRVSELEIDAASGKHAAFVFVKPHANNDRVKELLKSQLKGSGMAIVSEGEIKAEVIDEKKLIDTHYGAIAAKAVKLTPDKLNVQPKAQEAFQKTFGQSWQDAVAKGQVYNAIDGAKKLGISTTELGKKVDGLKAGVTLLKFGGGFYCGQIDGIFVINGFYMAMRGKFTEPGTSIYYYVVEWNPASLSWGDFREKVLGGTDPSKAHVGSARRLIYDSWQSLGLKAIPNTGDNGVHASASPFEALSEKCNWLGHSISKDFFGRGMLASGVSLEMLKAWCDDPQVSYEGKKQSLFDLLEDLDAGDCLAKSGKIAEAN